jgi:hypothetical protein
MIWIDKGAAPEELVAAEAELTAADNAAFDANPAGYSAGVSKFKFSTAYKSEPVKEALKARQYNKCCFSEAKFVGDYPHVEHMRPKGRVDDEDANAKMYPGYYWLAYDWANLFLCKALINIAYKKNFFPLDDETQRNKSHHDTYMEIAKIIDPGLEDPRVHIRFHKDEPRGLTPKGNFNIRLLGLRHPDFEEARRAKFEILEGTRNMIDVAAASGEDLGQAQLAKLITTLRAAVRPDAEFSSMAIDFLQGWPHLA